MHEQKCVISIFVLTITDDKARRKREKSNYPIDIIIRKDNN